MGAYLGLRDSWFWEDGAVLDAIEVLQGQADGTFYPTEYGPESLVDVACPDLWGYLVPRAEAEPFERLFAAREDEQIAELYGGRFAYARWGVGADGEPKVGFSPRPSPKRSPLREASARRRHGHGSGRGDPPPRATSTYAATWSRVGAKSSTSPGSATFPPPGSELPRPSSRPTPPSAKAPVTASAGKPVDDLRRFLLELHPRNRRCRPASGNEKRLFREERRSDPLPVPLDKKVRSRRDAPPLGIRRLASHDGARRR